MHLWQLVTVRGEEAVSDIQTTNDMANNSSFTTDMYFAIFPLLGFPDVMR